eukprot:763418-Hanusia_phi.AAC.9
MAKFTSMFKTLEAEIRTLIDENVFGEAYRKIERLWQAFRFGSIAAGLVGADEEEDVLVEAEKKRAAECNSKIVFLKKELDATVEQSIAVEKLKWMDMKKPCFSGRDEEVSQSYKLAREVQEHLTRARKLLTEAQNEHGQIKILAMKNLELEVAVRIGNNQVMEDIFQSLQVSANDLTDENIPFLFVAAASDNADGVEYLLKKNADINMVDSDKNTILHHIMSATAIKSLRYVSTVQKLNPNRLNQRGLTALHTAMLVERSSTEDKDSDTRKKYNESVEVLLSKYWKLNPNIQTTEKLDTALHIAAKTGNDFAMECLLVHANIDPQLLNAEGRTAMAEAILNRTSIDHLIRCQRVDLHVCFPAFQWTSLHYAVGERNFPVVRKLLEESHIDYGLEDFHGWTALQLAWHQRNFDAIQIILTLRKGHATVSEHERVMQRSKMVTSLLSDSDPGGLGLFEHVSQTSMTQLLEVVLECRMWYELHLCCCNLFFLAQLMKQAGSSRCLLLLQSSLAAAQAHEGVSSQLRSDLQRTCDLLVAFLLQRSDDLQALCRLAIETNSPAIQHARTVAAKLRLDLLRSHGSDPMLALRAYSRLRFLARLGFQPLFQTDVCLSNLQLESRTLRSEDALLTAQTEEALGRYAVAMSDFLGEDLSHMPTCTLITVQAQPGQGLEQTLVRLKQGLQDSCEGVFFELLRSFEHQDKMYMWYTTSDKSLSLHSLERSTVEALKNADGNFQKAIGDMKIIDVQTRSKSVFLYLDLILSDREKRNFGSIDKFCSSLRFDVFVLFNLHPNEFIIQSVSSTWNRVLIEFLPQNQQRRVFLRAQHIRQAIFCNSAILHHSSVFKYATYACPLHSFVAPPVCFNFPNEFRYSVCFVGDTFEQERCIHERVFHPSLQTVCSQRNVSFKMDVGDTCDGMMQSAQSPRSPPDSIQEESCRRVQELASRHQVSCDQLVGLLTSLQICCFLRRADFGALETYRANPEGATLPERLRGVSSLMESSARLHSLVLAVQEEELQVSDDQTFSLLEPLRSESIRGRHVLYRHAKKKAERRKQQEEERLLNVSEIIEQESRNVEDLQLLLQVEPDYKELYDMSVANLESVRRQQQNLQSQAHQDQEQINLKIQNSLSQLARHFKDFLQVCGPAIDDWYIPECVLSDLEIQNRSMLSKSMKAMDLVNEPRYKLLHDMMKYMNSTECIERCFVVVKGNSGSGTSTTLANLAHHHKSDRSQRGSESVVAYVEQLDYDDSYLLYLLLQQIHIASWQHAPKTFTAATIQTDLEDAIVSALKRGTNVTLVVNAERDSCRNQLFDIVQHARQAIQQHELSAKLTTVLRMSEKELDQHQIASTSKVFSIAPLSAPEIVAFIDIHLPTEYKGEKSAIQDWVTKMERYSNPAHLHFYLVGALISLKCGKEVKEIAPIRKFHGFLIKFLIPLLAKHVHSHPAVILVLFRILIHCSP